MLNKLKENSKFKDFTANFRLFQTPKINEAKVINLLDNDFSDIKIGNNVYSIDSYLPFIIVTEKNDSNETMVIEKHITDMLLLII